MFSLFSKKSAKEENKSNDAKFEIVEDDDEEEDSAFLKSLKLNLSRLIGIDIDRLGLAKKLKLHSYVMLLFFVCLFINSSSGLYSIIISF